MQLHECNGISINLTHCPFDPDSIPARYAQDWKSAQMASNAVGLGNDCLGSDLCFGYDNIAMGHNWTDHELWLASSYLKWIQTDGS